MKLDSGVTNTPYKGLYDDEEIKKPSRNKPANDETQPQPNKIFNEIDYGVNINDSVVYLHGDIQLGYLFDIISKFRIIMANRPEEKQNDPINLLINSNGGDVYEALGIIDYIESLSVPVNVIARGRAMSAAAMILCSGTGLRAASKNTTIMVHEASAEIFGKSADIKSNAAHIDDLEEDFYAMMERRTKKDATFWKLACRKDFYMNAESAMEYGLIDKII